MQQEELRSSTRSTINNNILLFSGFKKESLKALGGSFYFYSRL
jgi:hypothetical protein